MVQLLQLESHNWARDCRWHWGNHPDGNTGHCAPEQVRSGPCQHHHLQLGASGYGGGGSLDGAERWPGIHHRQCAELLWRSRRERRLCRWHGEPPDGRRSEEHTSELQSQSNLVCRLLLEKKKDSQVITSPGSYAVTVE